MRQDEPVWEEIPDVDQPLYRIDERPASWWESLLYGWQHTLVDISPFVTPLAVAFAIGMTASQQAQLINFCLFAMGLATLIQTTVGNRLPIIQGPSVTLIGTMAPVAAQLGAPAMWGGAFAGALVEAAIGASRLLTFLRRLFPPVVSGLVVISIGLSLGQVAVRLAVGDGSGMNFVLAGLVLGLIFLLRAWRSGRGLVSRGAIFFSIWIVGLGVSGLLGRVDWALVAEKPWFELPRFFPYGGPGFGWEFTLVAIAGIFAGYLGSIVESIGDYAATCAVSGQRFLVRHMNRGIFAEGLGCLAASVFGGLPCTSFTQNIGIIAATRVASRFVVQIAAVILLLYGLCPKFGALLVAMPRPVLGGVFLLVCGMIVVSGIRLLGAPGKGDSVVVGLSLVCALGVPNYVSYGLGDAWLEGLPALLRLVLTNTVVLAVVLGVGLNGVLGRGEKPQRARSRTQRDEEKNDEDE